MHHFDTFQVIRHEVGSSARCYIEDGDTCKVIVLVEEVLGYNFAIQVEPVVGVEHVLEREAVDLRPNKRRHCIIISIIWIIRKQVSEFWVKKSWVHCEFFHKHNFFIFNHSNESFAIRHVKLGSLHHIVEITWLVIDKEACKDVHVDVVRDGVVFALAMRELTNVVLDLLDELHV